MDWTLELAAGIFLIFDSIWNNEMARGCNLGVFSSQMSNEPHSRYGMMSFEHTPQQLNNTGNDRGHFRVGWQSVILRHKLSNKILIRNSFMRRLAKWPN